MDPKSGLRPYLQQDVDDILNAIIDDEGNVASQIKIVVNGRERLVNVGLIQNTAKFIWERPEPVSFQETIETICSEAFPKFRPPVDTIDGTKYPRKLCSAGLTKREGILVASLIYQIDINGVKLGEPVASHYLSDDLTKYQQCYFMHLLLAHGTGGHVGQGMADWDLYVNTLDDDVKFKVKL